MKRDKVLFYRNDRIANAALVKFISENPVKDARMVTFTNDDWCHEFFFENMPERDWDGVMSGIRVTTGTDDQFVFASWEDGISDNTSLKNSDQEYEHAYNMFIRSLTLYN